MNVYVVVEGRVVEKAVYTVWIPQVNPALVPVRAITDVVNNNFLIISGNGYPQYFDIIRNAFADVTSNSVFDRLVISIDSEDMTIEDKRQEIETFIASLDYVNVDWRLVIQHFCFETWALGNRVVASRNPKDGRLRKYKDVYNVTTQDPEGLPALVEERLNRSQFAEKYLRLMLNDRNKNISYSKGNPKFVAHPKYFGHVYRRTTDTGHIQSFRAFVDAFR
jgi:hypothetical protein